MNVKYTDTALGEIDDILGHIARDNPSAADEVSAVIRATIARLAEYPRMAVETDVPGVRAAPVLPYRYLVLYAVQGGTLIIRNVRHTARERP